MARGVEKDTESRHYLVQVRVAGKSDSDERALRGRKARVTPPRHSPYEYNLASPSKLSLPIQFLHRYEYRQIRGP